MRAMATDGIGPPHSEDVPVSFGAMNAFDLTGRTVVITGGNGGIGLGIARSLVEAGADVAIWARDPDKSASAVSELAASREGSAHIEAFSCDVTDPEQVAAAMSATLDAFGTVDSLFANAGAGFPGAFVDLPFETWRRSISLNLDGAFLCLQAAARHLVERGEGGSLVAVASTSAFHGAPANEAYAAAKAGVLALIRGLAVELARHRIRCNSLVPGWTETDLTAPLFGFEKFMSATTARTPVRRWGRPDDMGPVAVFLADPSLTFHTGDCVVVDGGYTVF